MLFGHRTKSLPTKSKLNSRTYIPALLFANLCFKLNTMNSIEINIVEILQKEREIFNSNPQTNSYSKYVKVIENLSTLVKEHLVKEKKSLKNREDSTDWFDGKKENYPLRKGDRIRYKQFPEPDYFTTNMKYFEYKNEETQITIRTTHSDYNLILALQIRQADLDKIYDLLELHREHYYKDFDELMYHLQLDYSFLYSQETRIILYNWENGAPKNHPKIFEKVEQWKNGTMVTMDAFEVNNQEEQQFESKELDEFLEYMMLTPTNKRQRRSDLSLESNPIAPIEIHEEKVDFAIEMRSVFLTEERNWGKREKYTKKQLEFLYELISIVQNYLYKNNIILQTKEFDPPYFWNNKRNWEKSTKERRQSKMFPELEYFILGDNIYYYYAEYSYLFEQMDTPNYQLFFAFRLRQMLLDNLIEFLNIKYEEFNGDFIDFLKLILIKYKCLFSKQTKTIAKKWMVANSKKSQGITNVNHNFEEEKDIDGKELNSFLKTPFLPTPKGYTRIEGNLKDHKIKKILSFFCEETNGAEEPFLSAELLQEVFKYGLVYPNEELKEKPFKFKLEPPKSKAIVCFVFYHLYFSHKDELSERDYKNQFAKLLKYQFSNFKSSNLESIRNLMNASPPKKLKRRLSESFFKNYME